MKKTGLWKKRLSVIVLGAAVSLSCIAPAPVYAAAGQEASAAAKSGISTAASGVAESGETGLIDGHYGSDYIAPVSKVEMTLPSRVRYIPVSYNGLTETPEIITPVKNQFANTCWAHGISFAAETDILKHNVVPGMTDKTLDLSERVMVYAVNYSLPFKDVDPLKNSVNEYGKDFRSPDLPVVNMAGSGRSSSLLYFNRWMGPVNELDADGNPIPQTHVSFMGKEGEDHIDVEYATPNAGHVIAHLENAKIINIKDRDIVKRNILEHGSVDCSYSVGDDSAYEGKDHTSYYNFEEESPNHEVALVGWDDDYPREKFDYDPNHLPEKNGAWLLRNSWGTDYGDHGYNWISYEDKSLRDVTALEMAPVDNYDNNYYYVGTVFADKYYKSGTSFATVFKTKEEGGADQVLKAVGLGIASSDTEYRIIVYKGDVEKLKKDPDGDGAVPAAAATGILGCAGVYTIPLEDEVSLKAGDGFSVVVTLERKDGDRIGIFGESEEDGKFSLNQHPGEALVHDGVSGWKDVSDPAANGPNGVAALNFAINAYTDRTDSSVTRVTGAESVSGGTVSCNTTCNEVTAEFTSSAGEGQDISAAASTRFRLRFAASSEPDSMEVSDESVVTVAPDGTFTAKGAGETMVRFYKDEKVKGYVKIRVRKEIKQEWFAIRKDNDNYFPGNNGITLYENVKAGEPGVWIPIGDPAGNYKAVSPDTYRIDYLGNDKVTDSAVAILKPLPEGCYHVKPANSVIIFSVDKCPTGNLTFEGDKDKYNESSGFYEYEYTGKEIRPVIKGLFFEGSSVKADYKFKGYKIYDSSTGTGVGDLMTGRAPRDVGTYCAVCTVDTGLFTDGTDSYNGEMYFAFAITPLDISNKLCDYRNRYTYTGNPIKPLVSVYHAVDTFKVYVDSSQYTVEYHNNIGPYDFDTLGVTDKAPYFTVSARDDSNYSGTVINENSPGEDKARFYFSIMPLDLAEKDASGQPQTTVALDAYQYDYTGKPIYPENVKVTYNGTLLTENTDFTVSFRNNRFPGKASAVIKGAGIYGGEVTCDFEIKEKNAPADTVEVKFAGKKAMSAVYTGDEIIPKLTVTCKGKKLGAGKYKVVCYDPENTETIGAVNAGTYGVAICPAEGSGVSFAVNNTLTFRVDPANASKLKITLSFNQVNQKEGESDEAYLARVKAGITPGVKSVMHGNKPVGADSYNVFYYNNTACGTATAQVDFYGNFSGIRNVPFKITGKSVSKLRYSKIPPQEVVFDENGEPLEVTPEITITDREGNPVVNKEKENDKYLVLFKDNRGTGKASVLVVGKGIYEGSRLLTFRILPRQLSKKEIIIECDADGRIATQGYTGQPVKLDKLSVTEVDALTPENDGDSSNYQLKNGRDYTVRLTGNNKPGTGRLTVTGKGFYKGKLTQRFLIRDDREVRDEPVDLEKLGSKLIVSINNKEVDNISSNKLYVPYTTDIVTPTVDVVAVSKDEKGEDQNRLLLRDYDYTLSYYDNKEASADPSGRHIAGRKQPHIVITGRLPNYTGQITVNFEIAQIELSESVIKPLWNSNDAFSEPGFAADRLYTGKPVMPVPEICYLKDGYEYAKYKRSLMPVINRNMFKIEFRNNTEIASANGDSAPTLIVKPKNMRNFAATGGKTQLEYRFNILQGDLAKATIAPVPAQTIKGGSAKPRPAVKLDGVVLKEGRDFNYVYQDNLTCGMGSVSIEPVRGDTRFVLNGLSPSGSFLIK